MRGVLFLLLPDAHSPSLAHSPLLREKRVKSLHHRRRGTRNSLRKRKRREASGSEYNNTRPAKATASSFSRCVNRGADQHQRGTLPRGADREKRRIHVAYLHRFVNQSLLNLQISLVEELLELLPVVELHGCGQAVLEAVDLYISLRGAKRSREGRGGKASQHWCGQPHGGEQKRAPWRKGHLLESICCISPLPNIRS